jgi:4-amino-4-deoxy-L-arabinose transferase-like glycosyltransferase
MNVRVSTRPWPDGIERAIRYARQMPDVVLIAVLCAHVAVWTVVPLLVCRNLQLDLLEGLALGREWQLGYWKHPPLPWWLADAAYRLTGDVRGVYLLGPLSTALAMYVVWKLAREMVAPREALIAVLPLEGLHFFNFSAVKFNHDVLQLPLWALTGWFVYRAIARDRALDWVLGGVFLALAFWTKYEAVTLAATLVLFVLLAPTALKARQAPGPLMMVLGFLCVLAPHLWWLLHSDLAPVHHAYARAIAVSHRYQHLWFPLRWAGSQAVAIFPMLLLVAMTRDMHFWRTPAPVGLAQQYVAALAIGPFAIVTLVLSVMGRVPHSMWGYPLWSLVPLAAVVWFPAASGPRRYDRCLSACAAVFLGWAVIYAGIELFEPAFRDRPKATQFPGQLLAQTITHEWQSRTGTPLAYVGGADVGTGPGEFAANNVAVYSPDHPRVIVHGNLDQSPWIDRNDLEQKGAVFIWEQAQEDAVLPANLRYQYPELELQFPLSLPRQTLRARKPAIIYYAFLLPSPAPPP